jgi:hypothetical protein
LPNAAQAGALRQVGNRPPGGRPREIYPEHDIFIQLMKRKNTLRWMRGEDPIAHLGLEYYGW